jgi:plasmid stabilization system protein ParE
MPRLIWSRSALGDVDRLHHFLAPKNPVAAARAVKAIRQGVTLLSSHPQAGRAVDDMEPGFREWPIGFGDSGYIVLYRYDGDDLVLLAIRHAREAGY